MSTVRRSGWGMSVVAAALCFGMIASSSVAWSQAPQPAAGQDAAPLGHTTQSMIVARLGERFREAFRREIAPRADREIRVMWPARLLAGVYRLKPGVTKDVFDARIRELYLASADETAKVAIEAAEQFTDDRLTQAEAEGLLAFLSNPLGAEIVDVLWSTGTNPAARRKPPPLSPEQQAYFDAFRKTESGASFGALFIHIGEALGATETRTRAVEPFKVGMCQLVDGPDCETPAAPGGPTPR